MPRKWVLWKEYESALVLRSPLRSSDAVHHHHFRLASFSSRWSRTCNKSSPFHSITCCLVADVKHFQIFFNTGLPGLFGPSNWFSSIDLQVHSSTQNGILCPLFHMSKQSSLCFLSTDEISSGLCLFSTSSFEIQSSHPIFAMYLNILKLQLLSSCFSLFVIGHVLPPYNSTGLMHA